MLETYAELIDGADIVAHCATRHAVPVYADWLADPACFVWVVQTATGTLVGYLVMTPAIIAWPAVPEDLEVQRIYVLSRYHRAGLGHALMAAAMQQARHAGARRLVLGVLKRNATAVAFYRRQGFTEIGIRVFQVGRAVFDDFVLGVAL